MSSSLEALTTSLSSLESVASLEAAVRGMLLPNESVSDLDRGALQEMMR